MRAVLLLLLVLAAGGALAYYLVGDSASGPEELDIDGPGARRPEGRRVEEAGSSPPAREELAPPGTGLFDPAEIRRLAEAGVEPILARQGLVLKIEPSARGLAHDIIEAVAKEVPLRFLTGKDRQMLEELEMPPHFAEQPVRLEEVLDVWRRMGLHVDPGSPVLVVGRRGP